MQVKTIDVLRRAKKLIRQKGKWGKHYYSIDVFGLQCPIDTGVVFCAAGAVIRTALDVGLEDPWIDTRELRNSLDALSRRRFEVCLETTNDNYGKKAALQVIDDAIAELEAQGH